MKQEFYTLTEYSILKYRNKSQRVSLRRWFVKGLLIGDIIKGRIYVKGCKENDDFINSKK